MSKLDLSSERDSYLKTGSVVTKGTLIILIVSLLVTATSLLVGLSTQPSFCQLCHQKKFKTWQQSSHQESVCNSCHQRSGILGMAVQRLEVVRMAVRYPSRLLFPKTITAAVTNDSCLRCHTDVRQNNVERNGIRMSHIEPDKAGYRCMDCHSGIVHNKKLAGLGEPSLGICINCHTGDQTAKCDTCHVENVVLEPRSRVTSWRLTHGKNWRKLHGMGNLTTCETCHRSSAYCKRCHGTKIPHSSGWLNVHGKEAKNLSKSCTGCHKQSLCNNCHGLKMPHPDSFLPKHASQVKKLGQKICDRCHHPDGCDGCHTRHIHPGVDPQIIEELRRDLGLGD